MSTFIRSTLFSRGHPLSREERLSDVLDRHKLGILTKIKNISDLSQLADSFLEQLVKESLVEPLAIQLGQKSRSKPRAEQIGGSQSPSSQVVRLSIPFNGDPLLLKYAPTPCGLRSPEGAVDGNTIQFDVILSGSPDDAQRVKDEIQRNCVQIDSCAGAINRQVKEFNESLPSQVKAAFTAKLDELNKQLAVFDDLDIPEQAEPPSFSISPAISKPKKRKPQPTHIILHIENQYVQQLNQINNNTGDVNNAIQSD